MYAYIYIYDGCMDIV